MKLQLDKKCRLSKTAYDIIQSRKGYRNDYDVLGGRTDSFERVLAYETMELGNRDIYHTIKQYYNISDLNLRQSRGVINRRILNLLAQHFRCKSSCLKCYWLCSSTLDVGKYYSTDNVKQIIIPNNYIIASDLGSEGVLVVSADDFTAFPM